MFSPVISVQGKGWGIFGPRFLSSGWSGEGGGYLADRVSGG